MIILPSSNEPNKGSNGINLDAAKNLTDKPSGISTLAGNLQPSDYQQFSKLANAPIFGEHPYLSLDKNTAGLGTLDDYLKAKNQSWLSQTGNMLGQAVLGEIVGQTIAGVGAILDIPEAIIERNTGNPHEFSNALTDIGNNITEWSKEQMPIYRENPNKAFDVRDYAWWADNGVSVASSLSLLIPGLGTAKAVGYTGKFLGYVNKISKLANVAGKGTMLTKLGAKIPMLGEKGKYWTNIFSTAVGMRHAENFREANQTLLETRNEALELFNPMSDGDFETWKQNNAGLDEDEKLMSKQQLADSIGSKAAWRSYDINSVNIVFDVLQSRLLFGFKPGSIIKAGRNKLIGGLGEKTTVNLAQKEILGDVVEKSLPSKLGLYFKDMRSSFKFELSEGAEEFINYAGNKEGNNYGKYLLKKAYDPSFGSRLEKYISDPHAWEAAFWGVGGGAVFTKVAGATGWAMDKFKGVDRNAFDRERITEIKSRTVKLQGAFGLLNQIKNGVNPYTGEEITGDEATIEKTKNELITDIKEKALTDMWINAAQYGNSDLLKQYFAHPEFIKQLENEYKLSPEEAVIFSKRAFEIGKDVESAYNKYANRLFTTPVNQAIKQVILNSAIKDDVASKTIKSKSNVIAGKLAKLKAEDIHYNKLIQDGVNVDGILELHALTTSINLMTEELSNQNPTTKKILNGVIESYTKRANELADILDKASINDLLLKGLNPDIVGHTLDKIYYDGASEYLVEKVAVDTSPKEVKKVETELKQAFIEANKEQLQVLKDKLAAITVEGDYNTQLDELQKEVDALGFKVSKSDIDIQKKKRGLNVQKEQIERSKPTEPITDEQFKDYIDNNIADESILNSIANKIIKKQPLSERETAIFTGKTGTINKIIQDTGEIEKEVADESTTDETDYTDGKFNVKEFGMSENLKKDKIDQLIAANNVEGTLKFIETELATIKNDIIELGLDKDEFLNFQNYLEAKQKELGGTSLFDELNNETDNIQFDTDFISESIRQQGGKGLLNVFTSPFVYKNDPTKKKSIKDPINKKRVDGNIIIDDEERARVIDYILNKLKVGTEVSISIDQSNPLYNKFADDANNVPLMINVPGINYTISYANASKYLESEEALVERIKRFNSISDFVNPLYNDILEYRTLTGVERLNALNRLKENDELIDVLKNKGEAKVDVKKNFSTRLDHLVNILFFGNNFFKSGVPNEQELVENLGNWNDKMNRDLTTLRRIRNVIGTDKSIVVKAKIAHLTSGAVVTSRDDKGKLIYKAVNESIGNNEDDYDFDIFTTRKNDKTTLAPIKTGIPEFEVTNLKGKEFAAGREYVVLKSGEQRIGIPLIRTNIGLTISPSLEQGELSDTLKEAKAYQKKLSDKLADYIFQLRPILQQSGIRLDNAELTQLKHEIESITIVSETYPDEDTQDDGRFKILVGAKKKVKFGEEEKTVDNRVQFKHDGKLVKIFFTEGGGINVDYDGKVVNSNKEGEDEVRKLLSRLFTGLERNVDYFWLKLDGPYYDTVSGIEYDSYKHYIIQTGGLITNIGKVLDGQGNKISNFTNDLTNNRSKDFVGFPLIINIKPEFETPSDELSQERVAGEETDNEMVKFAKSLITKDSADTLLPVIEKYNFLYEEAIKANIEIEQKLRPTFKDEIGNNVKGAYTRKENKVYFTQAIRGLSSSNRLGTFNHELVHGVIANGLKNDEQRKQFETKLKGFWATIKFDEEKGKRKITQEQRIGLSLYIFNATPDALNNNQQNELRNAIIFINRVIELVDSGKVEEIVTYGLTQPVFGAFLDSIKVKGENNQPESLWTKLKRLIVETFNQITGRSKLDELTDILNEQFNNNITDLKAHSNKTDIQKKLGDAFGDEFDSITEEGELYEEVGNTGDKESKKDQESSEFFITEGFTGEEENHLINVTGGLFLSTLGDVKALEDANVSGKGIDGIRIAILKHLRNKINDNDFISNLGEKQADLYNRYVENLRKYDSEIWEKSKLYITNEYNISPELIEQFTEQYLEKNWNDTAVLEMSSKDNVLAEIKLLILTTPKADANQSYVDEQGLLKYKPTTNTLSGLGETISFNVAYNTIANNMLGKYDKYEMLDAIKFMAENIDPSYYHIFYRVRENEQLLNAWYHSFNKQRPAVVVQLYKKLRDKFEVKPDYGNKKSLYETLEADDIVAKIKNRIANGYYTSDVISGIEKEKNTLVKYLNEGGNLDTDIISKQLTKLYKDLGITTNNLDKAIKFELEKESNIRKYYNQVPLNITNKKGWITQRLTKDKFVSSIDYLLDYINKANSNPNVDVTFSQYGNVMQLAVITAPFNEHRTDSVYMNVKTNMVQSIIQPDAISEWFKSKSDEDRYFEKLVEYTKDNTSQYYNWMWGNNLNDMNASSTFGLLDYVVKDGIKIPVKLNDLAYKVFSYHLDGGTRNTTEGKGAEYTDMLMDDWQSVKILNYFNSINKTDGNKLGITSFMVLPADRGRTIGINHNKIPMSKNEYQSLIDKDFSSFRTSEIWKAVYRTVWQDYQRMTNAMEFMFMTEKDSNGHINILTDEFGNYKLRQENVTKLVKNYHYKEGTDSKKQSIKLGFKNMGDYFVFDPSNLEQKDIGNVFKFNNIKEINNVEDIWTGKFVDTFKYQANIDKVKSKIDEFIYRAAQQSQKFNKKHLDGIQDIYTNVGQINHALAEYGINHYIAKVEMSNLFGLIKAFYKDDKDLLKRATQLLASGNSNADNGSFTGVTIADAYWQSENIKVLKQAIANGSILEKYNNINLGDAQSYITLAEYKKRLQINGKYNQFKGIIESLEKGKDVSPEDMTKVLSPLKEFYYSYKFDDTLQMLVPVQVKNSAQVLIPRLVKGTSLEALVNFMKENNIGQVNFASAEKVGARNVVNISSEGSMVKLDASKKRELMRSVNVYHYSDLRTQQEIPYHVEDTENKLGVQIARKILDNIQLDGKYGELTGEQVANEYFKLVSANIVSASKEVMDELDVTFEDGNTKVNINRVIALLEREALKRGLDANSIMALKQDITGDPTMPLYYGALQSKWMSILTSLFTNNVINQKFPGIHAAQMSNVFMEQYGTKGKSIEQKDSKVVFRKLKSQVLRGGSVIEAEVLLPAWSKDFYKEDGTLIDIKELEAAGLNKMVGYRIPTEGKYSTIVFKVVGFLPKELGATIVMPDDFVTQSGSDFDIDSIYTMLYQHEIIDGKFTKVEYFDEKSDEAARVEKYMRANRNKIYNSDTFKDFFDNNIKDKKLYEANKTINLTQIAELKSKYVYNEDGTVNGKLLSKINKARYKEGDEALPTFINEQDLDIVGALKSLLNDYNKYIKEEQPKEVAALPIEYQNTREARNNKILDIFFSILQSPLHYDEVVNPNSFDDITASSKYVQELLDFKEGDLNLFTDIGDAYFRNRVMEGRTLKGHSVNRDGFLSIAQFTKMELRKDLGIKITYSVDQSQYDALVSKYGAENVTPLKQEGKVTKAIVNHTLIGWTKEKDNYNNIEEIFDKTKRKPITVYAAQTTANILDNVKDPLPENVNPYTFGIWRTFVDLGATYKYATTFIRQPILKDLSDLYLNLVGIIGEGKGREIEEIKRDYQTSLYKLLKQEQKIPEKKNKKKHVYPEKKMQPVDDGLGGEEMQEVETGEWIYGVKSFDQSIESGDSIYIKREDTEKYLGYNPNEIRSFNQDELDSLLQHSKILDRKTGQSDNKTKDIAYYKSQLQLLEAFRLYKKSAEGIEDMNKATSSDKLGAGPDLIVTHNLINVIQKVNDYKDNEDEFAPLEEGSRIRIDNESAIKQIYPIMFGEAIDSKYPPVQEYFYRGNWQSLNLLEGLFISETNQYRDVVQQLLTETGRDINSEKLLKKINNYVNGYLLSDHHFFNIGQDEWNRILGIAAGNNVNIDITKEENLATFNRLPVYYKVELVRDQLLDIIKPGDVTNVLNYIQQSSTNEDYLKLNWINNDKDNYMIESFNNLYYSSNPFVKDLAKDLILYAYWESGLNFTYNSWSKIIPVNILKELGIGDHLKSKFDTLNNNEAGLDETFKEMFKRANSDDSVIVPMAYTKTYKKGKDIGKTRKGFPNWKPMPNGKITITAAQLEKESKDLQRSNIIKISNNDKLTYLKVDLKDQFNEIVQGSRNSVTQKTKKTLNIGDEINVWNGIEGKGAKYIGVKVTSIDKLGPESGKVGFNKIKFDVITKVGNKAPIKNSEYTIYKRTISEDIQYDEEGNRQVKQVYVYESISKLFPYQYTRETPDKDVVTKEFYDSLTPENREEKQRSDFYKDVQNFIKEYKVDIMKDMSAYKNSGTRSQFYDNIVQTQEKLNVNTQDIEDWKDVQLREALVTIIDHNISNLFTISESEANLSIIDKLKKFEDEDFTKGDVATKTKALTNFLWNAKLFTEGMLKIKDLTLIEERETDLLDYEGVKINDLVKTLKEQYARIESVDKRIDKLFNEHLERRIASITSNPEIQENIRQAFKPSRDLNKFQLQLDALMDADNPIVANFAKFYSREMNKADMEIYRLTEQFQRANDKFLAAGGRYEDILELNKLGENTGKWVQRYRAEFYDELREQLNNISKAREDFGEDSIEYEAARYSWEQWKLDNIEQEFVDDYYKVQLLLSPAARKVRKELAKQREEIYLKYKVATGHFDFRNISIDDRKALRAIKKKQLDYQDEKQHPEIAKSWNEYNEKLREFKRKSITFKQQFFDDYKEARASGTRMFRDFLIRNTQPTTEFWEQYGKIADELFGDKEAEDHVREYVDELLEPYKDDNGIVIGYEVPNDVRQKIANLLEDSPRELNQNLTDDRKKQLFAELDRLVDYVPSDYYYQERQNAIDNLKEGETLQSTKWYKDNHRENWKGEMKPLRMWTKMLPKKRSFKLKNGNLHWEHVEPRDTFVEKVLGDEFKNPKHEVDRKGHSIPRDKWKDSRYDKIQNTPHLKEYYDYLTDINTGLMNQLMSHFTGTIIEDGYIPAVSLDNRGIFKKIAEKMGMYDIDRNDEMALFYKNNQQIRFVPINFISLLKERKLYEIPPRESGEMVKDYQARVVNEVNKKYDTNFRDYNKLLKTNKLIEEHNKALKSKEKHGLNISYNMQEVIPAFINTATKHKYKKSIEAEVLLMRDYVEHMQVQKVTGRGKSVYDPYKVLKKLGNAVGIEINKQEAQLVKGSNYNVRFDKWLEMVFYEEFELDEGQITKASRVLQNYTSLKGIGLNPFSALNNVVYGRIQTAIEAAAGQHFNMKNYLVGKKHWNKGVVSYVADTYSNTNKATSLENAIIKYFGILDEHNDTAIEGSTTKNVLHKFYMKTNAFYLMQHMGEHYMQNVTLFAMMDSHRIVNGKVMSLSDYKASVIKEIDVTLPIGELKEKAMAKKAEEKKLEEQFNGFPKLIDAYTLNDGFIAVKDGFTISEDSLADFKTKVKGVNHKIHGIYNREDKGILNNIALGRLILQFRHWARPGWNKRWGTRFGKSFWNERRNEMDKGSYVSAIQFFTIPFKNKGKKNWSEDQEWNVFRAALAVMRDYGQFIKNAQVYWLTLSPTDQANVKRAVLEMTYLFGAIIMLQMLRKLGDDDDELKESKMFNALLYQMDRTVTELNTYSPHGWFNETAKLTKSPTATWKTLTDAYKLGWYALQFPFQEDDERRYQNGIYNDKYKVAVIGSRMLPGLSVYQRLLYLEKSNNYYKLF